MARIDREQELQLLEQVLLGDRNAWRAFRSAYESLIRGTVVRVWRRYHVVAEEADVDDMVSDVWLTLLSQDMRRLRAFDPRRGTRLASWIGLISANASVDRLRQKRTTVSIDDTLHQSEDLVTSDTPFTAAVRRQRLRIANAAFQRLSDGERRFIVAYLDNDDRTLELARDLGISLQAAYSRKHRTRIKLERIVARLCSRQPARRRAYA